MRSRYTAYVMHNMRYLLDSWHTSTRPPQLDFDSSLKWLGLKIIAARSDGDQAIVEFMARYRVGGASAARLHEVSRFVREQGRWFYVAGNIRQ